jgi:hypothetical protein
MQWKRDVRFSTWNVRSLYRPRSLATDVRELARYKLYFVGVQEVRREKGGTARTVDYTFFCGKENENRQFGTGYFFHQRIIPAVNTVEFVVEGCYV